MHLSQFSDDLLWTKHNYGLPFHVGLMSECYHTGASCVLWSPEVLTLGDVSREEGPPSSTLNETFEDFGAMPTDGSPYMNDQGVGDDPAAGQDAPAGGQDADESYGDGDAEGDAEGDVDE